MHTERGFDRIVNFSDATVAIAITLLILPLVDIGGVTSEHQSLWALFTENANEIFGFVISFLVIWSLWVNHHRVMEYFAGYDSTFLGLHLLWLLTVVCIPFTTQLITNQQYYLHGAVSLYVAVLLISSVALHALALRGRRHPELLHPDRPEVRAWLASPDRWTTMVLLAVILVIVSVFPWLGAWPLLLLFVDGLVQGARDRRHGFPQD